MTASESRWSRRRFEEKDAKGTKEVGPPALRLLRGLSKNPRTSPNQVV